MSPKEGNVVESPPLTPAHFPEERENRLRALGPYRKRLS